MNDNQPLPFHSFSLVGIFFHGFESYWPLPSRSRKARRREKTLDYPLLTQLRPIRAKQCCPCVRHAKYPAISKATDARPGSPAWIRATPSGSHRPELYRHSLVRHRCSVHLENTRGGGCCGIRSRPINKASLCLLGDVLSHGIERIIFL